MKVYTALFRGISAHLFVFVLQLWSVSRCLSLTLWWGLDPFAPPPLIQCVRRTLDH